MGHHRDTLETNREFVPQSSEIQSLGIETTDRGQHLALLLPREARETDATRIDRGSKGMPELLLPVRVTVKDLLRDHPLGLHQGSTTTGCPDDDAYRSPIT